MLTYGILVKDELDYLQQLLPRLIENKHKADKIMVLVDEVKTPDEVLNYLSDFSQVRVEAFRFQRDFSAMRNYFKELCETQWMFQIDCDELPSIHLIRSLNDILLHIGNEVDAIALPRINTYEGLTEEYIEEEYLQVVRNDRDWYFWPDYQYRLCRCVKAVAWKGDIHETLTGFRDTLLLPQEEDYAILHHKTFSRQQSQTEFYRTFENHVKLETTLKEKRKHFSKQLEALRERFGIQ